MLIPRDEAGRWKPGGGQCPPNAVVDDAVEEVDREERAEEHDLRRDEQEHAEHRRRDARAVVDRRRAVVLVASACALMRAPRLLRRPRPRGRPGRPVSLRSRSTRSRRSQPLRSPGNVETMISSTRSSLTACMRGGVRVGVHDLAVRVDALAAQLGERAAQAAVGVVVLARRRSAARRSGSSPGPARRAARMRSSSSSRDDGLVRDHEHVLASSVVARRRRRASPGCRPRRARCPRRRCGASSPSAPRRCVETTISSTFGSSCASASLTACTGPGLDDEALRAKPGLAQRLERLARAAGRRRRGACPRRRHSPARLVDRRDHRDAVVAAVPRRAARRAARATRRSRSRSRGRAPSVSPARRPARDAARRRSRGARRARRTRTGCRRPAGSRRS